LGDIYQSWPTLRGLKRKHADAEIHVMVRPRFADALTGLDVVTKLITLPTQDFFVPLMNVVPNTDEGLSRIDSFLNSVKSENYDAIINLSFSPLSSYLTHSLAGPNTDIVGYTRHNDGYFNMVGEVSSYFYAQVGTDRHNRIHLTDLMAAVAGVDLTPEDWADANITGENRVTGPYVVFHIGASENHKSIPPYKWSRILKYFSETCPDLTAVLVGSKQEKQLAEVILTGASGIKCVNLVGETKITELFPVIRNARLLVGGDSAPIHIAGLTKTPTLNVSIGQVNFWETGPRSPKSYIMRAEGADGIVSEYVAGAIKEILEDKVPENIIRFVPEISGYEVTETPKDRFCWDLITALYMGSQYPMTEDLRFFEGIQKLNSINEVILEQMTFVRKTGLEKMKPILDRSDEVIETLGHLVPDLQIFVRWLRAERARMAPGTLEELISSTTKMHLNLKKMLRPYVLDDEEIQEGGKGG
jgi:ADP-heptose:LPS heptosyltransferase